MLPCAQQVYCTKQSKLIQISANQLQIYRTKEIKLPNYEHKISSSAIPITAIIYDPKIGIRTYLLSGYCQNRKHLVEYIWHGVSEEERAKMFSEPAEILSFEEESSLTQPVTVCPVTNREITSTTVHLLYVSSMNLNSFPPS